MAKTSRQTLVQFGSSGPTNDFEQFGSTAAGSTNYTKTIATIQSLAAWATGWRAALLTGKAPTLQDMNAAMFVAFYEIFYLLENGVSEWDAGTTYYIGSVVRRVSTNEFYSSLTDTNLNNALPSAGASNTNWQFLNGIISGSYRIGGALAMNSQKVTGLANATTSSDAMAFGQMTAANLVGTATNDNATAGNLGEYVVGTVVSAGTVASTGTWKNAVSISLTAGDWDVTGIFQLFNNGGTVTQYNVAVDTASAGPTGNTGDRILQLPPGSGNGYSAASISAVRISIAVTTTVYAEVFAQYSAGSPQYFCRLSARRAR